MRARRLLLKRFQVIESKCNSFDKNISDLEFLEAYDDECAPSQKRRKPKGKHQFVSRRQHDLYLFNYRQEDVDRGYHFVRFSSVIFLTDLLRFTAQLLSASCTSSTTLYESFGIGTTLSEHTSLS